MMWSLVLSGSIEPHAMVLNAMVHKSQSKDSLVSGPMVRDRVSVWAIVSVWVSFRVEVWARFRIRVRMRVRVDVQVSVCFWGLH